jgi:5-methylcytosine-specific restriction endonuclease McrA
MAKIISLTQGKEAIVDNAAQKICNVCGKSKPISEFPRAVGERHWVRPRCRGCEKKYKHNYYLGHQEEIRDRDHNYRHTHQEEKKERARIYYLAHAEEEKGRTRKWQQTHTEEVKELNRKYYQEHREEAKEFSHDYYQDHREDVDERNRIYSKKHPEYKRIGCRNRRARILNASGNGWSAKDEKQLKQDYSYRCAYCGKDTKLELDHIVPISRGGKHAIENIVPACRSCNSSKGSKSLLKWMYEQRKL